MNDEHYDNRVNTVRVEIETRQEQKASLEKEQEALREKLIRVSGEDRDSQRAAD